MRIDQHHFNAESDLIESLLNHDSSIIPSSSRLILFSMSSPRLLYDNSSPRPPEEFVSENSNADVESFSPFPIRIEDSNSFMEEIDLTFTPDDPMPPSIEEDNDDLRDILIREELLDNYSLPLLENESFHFDIHLSSCPPAKPTDGFKYMHKTQGLNYGKAQKTGKENWAEGFSETVDKGAGIAEGVMVEGSGVSGE
nr:hypothetical protein [Tanacetum cinerariifolium]